VIASRGWHAEGQRLIDVAVAVDPDPRRVAIRRALAAKDEEVLLELAERGVQTPLDPQTAVSLATSLIGFRHLEQAAEMLAASAEAHLGEFALHRMLGFLFEDLGEPYRERARLHYTAALAIQPSSVNALHGLAELAVDEGDLKRAEQLYRRGLEINPDHYASWHSLAVILTDEKEHERCLRRCIELWPTGWEAKVNLGRLLHMTDRAEESVALLREVVEVAPDSFLAWNHLGTAYGKTGDRLHAIAAQRRAIELQPDDISSLFNLAIELRGLGQLEDALELARRARDLAPEHPLLNYGVGETLILLGREAEGLERVEWLLRAEPESVHANGWVARLAANAADTSLRDPKRALASAEVVLAATPRQVAAGLAKSLALLRSGEFEAALAAVDEAARIPSTMLESLELTRALALCGLERRDEARAVLAALGDVRDDSGDAYSRRERDRLLEELRAALAR
jgi:tetratricopeptide (TPR) repeat protein